jgi:hypothetical protein
METHWTTPKTRFKIIQNPFPGFFSCVANFAASKLDGCRFQAPEKATRLVLSFHVMPGDASC